MNVCSCFRAWYCGADCQLLHWATHNVCMRCNSLLTKTMRCSRCNKASTATRRAKGPRSQDCVTPMAS
jgi:hypothetical protein